eukprot:1162067-Pelagomonas_calceolata.AAC.11
MPMLMQCRVHHARQRNTGYQLLMARKEKLWKSGNEKGKREEKTAPAKRPCALRKDSLTSKLARVLPKDSQA